MTETLKQTVTAIDEALSQVPQAFSLAIEEAAGNVEEFTEHDLKRAYFELQTADCPDRILVFCQNRKVNLFLNRISNNLLKSNETANISRYLVLHIKPI